MDKNIRKWVEALDTLPVVYYIKPAGHILMLCPFHKERYPSLRVWTNGSWLCHGCGCGPVDTKVGDKVENYIQGFLDLYKERYPIPLHPNQIEFDLDAITKQPAYWYQNFMWI